MKYFFSESPGQQTYIYMHSPQNISVINVLSNIYLAVFNWLVSVIILLDSLFTIDFCSFLRENKDLLEDLVMVVPKVYPVQREIVDNKGLMDHG